MTDEGYQPFPDISAWTAVPFDPTTYDQYAALLEQARAEATEEAREHAVRTAIRYAGTDTGAIEGLYTTDRGFTRTVAIEAASWEAMANERGPNAAQLIKDQIEAYEWLLDLVTESRPVTESVIRELHAILCRSQETYVVHTEVGSQERALPKGEYKQFPNNPTSLATGQIHHYAPPDMVAPEVHRLVASLSTDEYRNAHPVIQAAYLHYSLVAIHPFADGNGRTTRALASVPLYKALRVPLIVFRDQRDEYLDALGATDVGSLQVFVDFVRDRVLDAADVVRFTVTAGSVADIQRSLTALSRLRLPAGLRSIELDTLAHQALEVVRQTVRRDLEVLEWPERFSWTFYEGGATDADFNPPPMYRWAKPRFSRILRIGSTANPPFMDETESDPLLHVRGTLRLVAAVAVSGDVEPVTLAVAFSGSLDSLYTSLSLTYRDIIGGLSEAANIKIESWTNHCLGTFLADLVGRAMDEATGTARRGR